MTGKPLPEIFMVDNHQFLLKGMQAVIESSGDFYFCGSAENIEESLKSIDENQPDLVLIEACLAIRV